MSNYGPFNGAVFDCDGTLVDTESIWLELISELMGTWSISSGLEAFHGVTASEAAELICAGSDHDFDTVKNHIDARYTGLVHSITSPFPKAAKFLASLDIPVGMATNSRRTDIDVLLPNTGLADYFDTVQTADDVSMGKPDPEIYLKACQNIGVSPEQVMVFEDSEVGVQAAVEAGCFVVALGLDSPKASITVSGFTDISFNNSTRLLTVKGHQSSGN